MKDWKARLRYGKLITAYSHVTLIIDGIKETNSDDPKVPLGPCFMGVSVWAESDDQAIAIARELAPKVGFAIAGSIQLFETEGQEPPGEKPSAYGVNFTPYVTEQ